LVNQGAIYTDVIPNFAGNCQRCDNKIILSALMIFFNYFCQKAYFMF